jgi:hypothetical protein
MCVNENENSLSHSHSQYSLENDDDVTRRVVLFWKFPFSLVSLCLTSVLMCVLWFTNKNFFFPNSLTLLLGGDLI